MSTTFIYGLYSSANPSNIRYIGKTIQSLNKRLYEHLHDTKNSYKINWIKQQTDLGHKIKIKLIDTVWSTDWDFWEMHWIQEYRRRGFKLTNLAPGGTQPDNLVPIVVLDLKNNVLGKFNSTAEAARAYNIREKCVAANSRGETKTYKNKRFIKEACYDEKINYSYKKYGKTSKNKKVFQYDLEGKFIKEYHSMFEASQSTGANNINVAISGIQQQSGGFRWSFDKMDYLTPIQPKNIISVYTKEDNTLIGEFTTIKEAADYFKFTPKAIYKVFNEGRNYYKGYIFKKL